MRSKPSERERNSLDAAMAFCKGGRWLDGVLRANAAACVIRCQYDADGLCPLTRRIGATWLRPYHKMRFSRAFATLLTWMGWRPAWPATCRLDELKAALAVRQQAFARHQDRLKALNSARVLADSRQRIAALTQEVGLAKPAWMAALADSKQRDMLASANRLVSLAQKPNASPELAVARSRSYGGHQWLNWQLAQEAPAHWTGPSRIWLRRKMNSGQAQTHADTIARLLREGPVAMDQWGIASRL